MAAGELNICVSGALGAVGRALVAGIVAADGCALHSAVARREAGRDVGELVLGRPIGVRLEDDLAAALDRRPDVVIDYTHPAVIRRHIDLALTRSIPIVIGTTGLTDADFEHIDAAARAAGVGAATGNFSMTAALMQHLARFAARHVPDWEIVEYGPASKPDAPSGTARELAELLARERAAPPTPAVAEPIGPPEARGAEVGGGRVHSLRLHGSSPAVEVVFGLPGERLVIRHDEQGDPGIFVQGSLLAAARVCELQGLVRGLDRLLFEPFQGQ
ncbi:MAG TPA: 4-hydroxy-tetrahydrodipicolinate reductase [Gaiellales bacterium]|jgi:4-hydroxy-tetrahydrodipicolinate reductase